MPVFGDRLKQLRTEKKLMQKDLSSFLGITTLSYQRYEYGDREPSYATLSKLCSFFNISADYLLGLSDTPRPLKD